MRTRSRVSETGGTAVGAEDLPFKPVEDRMRRIRWSLRILAVSAGVMTALAADNIDVVDISEPEDVILPRMVPNAVDVRGIGMGKMGVALAEGAHGIFVNPAIPASLEKSAVQAGGRLKFGTVTDEYAESRFPGSEAREKLSVKPTNVAAAVPIIIPALPLSLAAGVGYHSAYDFTEKLYSTSAGSERTTRIRGGLELVSPVVSVGLMDRYFFGVAVNLSVFNKLTVKQENALRPEETEEFDGSAAYATLGVLAKPIEHLTVGVGYQPHFEWDYEQQNYEVARVLSVGAYYQIMEQLGAGVELQPRLLSELTREDGKFDNGIALRGGAEYLLGPVALRAGGFYEAVPRTDIDQSTGIVGDEPEYIAGAGLGIGLPIEMVRVDVAGTWTRFAREETYFNDTRTATETFAYAENDYRVDLGVSVELPALAFKERTFEDVTPDTTLGPAIEEPGRRKPIYGPEDM